jgi:hypothetical protein
MKPKSEIERPVRQAEAELDAATARSALDTAANRLMRAREALKRSQGEPHTGAEARLRAAP